MSKSAQAVFFFVLFTHINAPAAKSPDFAHASAVLKKAVEDRVFPGCSVVVGTQKKIIWSQGIGYLDYEHKVPVTRDTIYDLASVTKVAATTSVFMRLVAQGKIKATEPVSKYIPEFIPTAHTEEEKAQRRGITIEHLLTHTSGLITWQPFYKTIGSYPDMIGVILKTPLSSPPGIHFRYSDPGMMLLGEIASRAGGKPLDKLEQELVFRPLKMKNTLRNPPQKLWSRIPPTEKMPDSDAFVHGVVHDENARAAEGITGHAGLFSTAEDLARLASELLLSMEGKSKLFPRDVVSDFVRERNGETRNWGRGLGWAVSSSRDSSENSSTVISHTGFTGTSIRIDLDRKFYIILLSNRVHPSRDNDGIGRIRSSLTRAVVEALDGEK